MPPAVVPAVIDPLPASPVPAQAPAQAHGRGAPAEARRPLSVRLLPWLALLVGLLVLAALVAGTILGARQGSALDRATVQGAALAEARTAAARLHAEERAYAAQPGPVQRGRVDQSTIVFSTAIARLDQLGIPAADLPPGRAADAAQAYKLGVLHLMAAADAGSADTVAAVDAAEIRPGYDRLDALLAGTAAQVQATARALASSLHAMLLTAAVAAPLLFLAGVVAMAVFWRGDRQARRAEEAARVTQTQAALLVERRYRGIVQHAADMVLLCDGAGVIVEQNTASRTVWRFPVRELPGQAVLALVHPEDQPAIRQFWEQLTPATEAAPASSIDLRMADGDGRWRDAELSAAHLLADSAVAGVVLTIRDIGRRRAFERQLAEHAVHDPQTRLPNALLFADRLDQAVLRARRGKTKVGLLLIDLADPDGRPTLRDSLLAEAGQRLRGAVRAQDTVARLAGSRFAVVLEGIHAEAGLVPVADRVHEQFAQPFAFEGRQARLAWSGGMALDRPTGDAAQELVRNAGLALAQSTASGAGRCVVFGSDMQARSLDMVELVADLRAAEVPHEMVVHYQPVVALATGQLRGLEALVRWVHPKHGMVAARDFLLAAEETGQIVPLGRWVLDSGCRQLALWQAAFGFDPPLTLGVNLSPRQVADPSLLVSVERALRGSRLPPESLVLELREGTLLDDAQRTLEVLWAIKRLGVRVALDNFGTGSAALPSIRQLPLDMLKVAGTFVRNIGHDPDDTLKVQASVALGRSLGLQVSGDGIETEEQAAQLAAWQCELGQGHLYGRPGDAQHTEALLRAAAPPGWDREDPVDA